MPGYIQLARDVTTNRSRYIHRRAIMTISGNAGSQFVSTPPGRLISLMYGKISTTDTYGAPAAATSGALTIKADAPGGTTIFTDADISSVPTRPLAVGTTAVDEGRAATAATDAFSGGFPVRAGVNVAVATGTDGEVIVVDMLFRVCSYVRVDLVSQSGADGAGAATQFVNFGNAGVLAAVALDFQNMPATTDITLRADTATGPTLFASTNSATDLAPSLLGNPGGDEAAAASAATDGTEAGTFFRKGIHITMAEADAFTSSNEKVVIELWCDQ